MKLLIVAVGQRVPDWAQTAYDDYAKRFPPELRVELKAVKTEPRGSKTLDTLLTAERERIEAAIPRGAHVVALDERGTTLTTKALAQELRQWQLEGDDVVLVIGGPDGLDPAFAPGTGTPSHGGFLYYEVLELLQHVARNHEVVGMDLVEVAPDYDPSQSTQILAAQVLLNFLGFIFHAKGFR